MSDWTERQVMEGYRDENGNPVNVDQELENLKQEEINPFVDAPAAPEQAAGATTAFTEDNPFAVVGDNAPVAEQPIDIATVAQQPQGIGPVANAAQYSEMIRPGYGEARESVGPWTARTMLATEAAIPVAGSWADELYSAIRSTTNPKLSYEEWNKAIQEEQDELPMMDTAGTIATGAVAGYALPWGMLKLAKDSATAMKIASGFNTLGTKKKLGLLALASGAEGAGSARGSLETSEGQKEAMINSSFPLALKGFAELAGRGTSYIWKKAATDVDTTKAITELVNTPHKFDDLVGAQEEREAAIRIYGQVVDKINEMHDAGKLTVEQAAKKIEDARKEWSHYEDYFSAAASKAGNLSNDETSGVFKAYKDLQTKVRLLEKDAIAKLPETNLYLSAPDKYGFKLSDIDKKRREAVAYLKNSSKTYKDSVIGDLNGQMEMFYRMSAEDAIANGADPSAVSYVLRNRQWLVDESSRGVLSGRNISQKRLMDEAGTNLKDVNNAVKLMANVSPARIHEMKGSLFERGSGYVGQKDLTEDKKFIQKVYKDWHTDIRGNMATKYPTFEEATKVAENLKKDVFFPIKQKLKLKEVDQDGARLAFERFAKENLDQSTNVINRWSNEIGVDLLRSANRIRHLDQFPLTTSGGKWNLSFDEMMGHFAEKKKVATEVLDGIKMLPPDVRAKFGDLEIAAMKAADSQKDIDMLTERLLKESEQYGKIIGMKTMRRDGGGKSVQSIVEEITNKRYNPSSKSLFDVTPDVRDAQEIERFGRDMFPNGIPNAMGGTVQINGLANRLQDVRKQELLDKSLNLFKGSSAANIGQAVGQVRGSKSAALLSFVGGLANSIGSFGAKTVVKNLMKSGLNSHLSRTYGDFVTANIARNVLPAAISYSATPGTQELAEVIDSVRNDKKVAASDKIRIIKDLRENGLSFQFAMND
jgi:hypothetical protein